MIYRAGDNIEYYYGQEFDPCEKILVLACIHASGSYCHSFLLKMNFNQDDNNYDIPTAEFIEYLDSIKTPWYKIFIPLVNGNIFNEQR